MKIRCAWTTSDPLYLAYHDEEWGVPMHDCRALFEMLILEGAQAGLSWLTILRKRSNYRRLFDHFDATRVARYDEEKVNQLLADPGIVRNRLKIKSAVTNAQAMLEVSERYGSFDAFIWSFVDNEPRQNAWESVLQVPARTPESDAMSKQLKKMGFTFVGSTICYAFMQAVGMVNDHTTDCFRHEEVKGSAGR
jgi:DNA-3-methyladenine glycosylase I